MRFIDHLYQKWLESGDIPFVQFMQEALYAPNLGYYSGGSDIFGQAGDFITAPELTPLFGYTFSQQCKEVLTQVTSPIILVFGAGSGRLCVDILTRLKQLNCMPE